MTPDELRNHLRTLDLCDDDRTFALDLFGQGPGRKVGKYALDNVIVDFYSRKCRDIRSLESHTVEQTFAFELELDPDVIAYVCQVSCRGVRRGHHVSNTHADFFVIRRGSAEVVECKPTSKLDRLIEKRPDEWIKDDGQYRNLVYEAWAASHGISYRVWTSSESGGRYHRNLQFIVQNWDEELSLVRREGFSEVHRELSTGPKNIAHLMEAIPWFNAGLAAGLIADQLVYGPIECVPITDIHRFFLSLSSEQAESIAEDFRTNISNLYLDASGPASLASPSDVTRGHARLERLDRLVSKGEPIPRWLNDLHTRVALARAQGRNPLHEATTNLAKSGNRHSRLTSAQESLVAEVIRNYWLKGRVISVSDLHRELALQCERAGIPPPGRKALESRIRGTSRAVRDLAVGGKRRYQANKARSDARFRSGAALAVHSVLHIDATKVDHRAFIQGPEGLEDQCPLLYTGRDEASGYVMCHAFVFGPARRDGPLMLIRNYVRKHACVPHSIVIDRGTDLKSGLSEFCRIYGISILTVPTGGCRYNSQCETIQGQINAMVSHRLIGSTKPDQAGRSVDGKFKSRSTARMDFSTTETEIAALLYTILPDLPIDNSYSARERLEHLEALAPKAGIPVVVDDDFNYRTSIKLSSTCYERTRGYRSCGRSYTNSDLSTRSDDETIVEVRRDPEDTTFVWVQTNRRRYKAWCSKVSEVGHYSPEDRCFEAMWDQLSRPQNRLRKDLIQRQSYERTSAANERQRSMDACHSKPEHSILPTKSESAAVICNSSLSIDFSTVPNLLLGERRDLE